MIIKTLVAKEMAQAIMGIGCPPEGREFCSHHHMAPNNSTSRASDPRLWPLWALYDLSTCR